MTETDGTTGRHEPRVASEAETGIGADTDGTTSAVADAQRAARLGALMPVLVVGLTMVVIAAGIVVSQIIGDDDSDGGVRAGSPGDRATGDATPTEPDTPQVAVLIGYGGEVGDPIELTLRFVDAGGNVVATRHWSEMEDALPDAADGTVSPTGGLLQDLPVGDVHLQATLQLPDGPQSCTQPFTVAAGDRLIVDLQSGPLGAARDRAQGALVDDETHPPEITCAQMLSLDEWLGRTHPGTSGTGEDYVGLTLQEAEQKAADEGLSVRVVGEDGMSFAVTMDLNPSRLDVVVWDGRIVAANLPDGG